MKIDKNILKKVKMYCAKTERSTLDVKLYLQKLEVNSEDIIEKIINNLKSENFINEERYIRAFINDKFKLNKWGKYKIKQSLLSKGFDENDIDKLINETINEEEYKNTLTEIIEKKKKLLKKDDTNVIKQKISKFALSKGYEPDLIKTIVESIMSKEV